LKKVQTGNDKRIVCYYTNWSIYRHAIVPVLYPDSIDPKLCTHIHFAFAQIDPITFEIQPSENHDVHYTSVFSTVNERFNRLFRRFFLNIFHHLAIVFEIVEFEKSSTID